MSTHTALAPVVLEPASQAFVEATATPPFLYQLTPAEARAVLDDVQAAPIDKLPIEDRWITVPADVGDVRVRIVRPAPRPGLVRGGRLVCEARPLLSRAKRASGSPRRGSWTSRASARRFWGSGLRERALPVRRPADAVTVGAYL